MSPTVIGLTSSTMYDDRRRDDGRRRSPNITTKSFSLIHLVNEHTTVHGILTMPSPQPVLAPLTRAATFLVLTVAPTSAALGTVRGVLSSFPDLCKNVSVRDNVSRFAATVGIGSEVWDRLTRLPRPKELRPFPAAKLVGSKHSAPATPGDLLVHIRSDRRDLNFEFERILLDKLGDSVQVVDETSGFRYFDGRDLLGFVDGTANPDTTDQVTESVVINSDDGDPEHTGGSYVVIQKYLHDLTGWKNIGWDEQEKIVGRTKLDNVELPDAKDGQQASHKTLNTIEKDGVEYDILRDNMPFGAPGQGEYGTYFIGYSRRLWVTEQMLERMFIGNPPGKYDRILDYSRAVTGSTYFVPSLEGLDKLGDED